MGESLCARNGIKVTVMGVLLPEKEPSQDLIWMFKEKIVKKENRVSEIHGGNEQLV